MLAVRVTPRCSLYWHSTSRYDSNSSLRLKAGPGPSQRYLTMHMAGMLVCAIQSTPVLSTWKRDAGKTATCALDEVVDTVALTE